MNMAIQPKPGATSNKFFEGDRIYQTFK